MNYNFFSQQSLRVFSGSHTYQLLWSNKYIERLLCIVAPIHGQNSSVHKIKRLITFITKQTQHINAESQIKWTAKLIHYKINVFKKKKNEKTLFYSCTLWPILFFQEWLYLFVSFTICFNLELQLQFFQHNTDCKYLVQLLNFLHCHYWIILKKKEQKLFSNRQQYNMLQLLAKYAVVWGPLNSCKLKDYSSVGHGKGHIKCLRHTLPHEKLQISAFFTVS